MDEINTELGCSDTLAGVLQMSGLRAGDCTPHSTSSRCYDALHRQTDIHEHLRRVKSLSGTSFRPAHVASVESIIKHVSAQQHWNTESTSSAQGKA